MSAQGDIVGTTLANRYRILRPVGQGGMGVVYEAEQLDLARRVAIKLLAGGDDDDVERFRQEAMATASLRCPHVVTVLDFGGGHGEAPFLVMELLDGTTLASRLVAEKRLSIETALRIIVQVLEGLGAAHGAGILHRDVKPSNVFLVRSASSLETVKLLDFGVAKVLRDNADHTTTGTLVGTPAYMAPEQLRGDPLDARVDVHAAGVCLFEMLAGQLPWGPRRGPELTAAILRDEAPDIRTVRPDVPAWLAEVLRRALAKSPAARFPSAAAMARALSASAAASVAPSPVAATDLPPAPTVAMPTRVLPRPPKDRAARVFLSVAAPLVMAGLVLGGYAVFRGSAAFRDFALVDVSVRAVSEGRKPRSADVLRLRVKDEAAYLTTCAFGVSVDDDLLLELSVDEEGRVIGASGGGPAALQCIAERARGWRFGVEPGSGVQLLDFRFRVVRR